MVATDVDIAVRAARAAADELVRLRQGGLTGRALGDAGDHVANEAIWHAIVWERPGDVFFSEESADDLRRLSAERVWIIDPLDGTREYGEPGRHDWAVHVALWSAGELTTAAVALPGLGEVLTTDPAPGSRSRHRCRMRTGATGNRPSGPVTIRT